jgi:tetratricopeptide (TPR) repeat protein
MDWAFLKHGAASKHVAAHVLFAGILVAILPVALQSETANDIASLNRQIFQLYGQSKYAEAASLAREALSLTEQMLGKEHPDTLTSVNNLALLYQAEGRLAEAEPLYKRALEASERVLGKKHPDTLTSVNNLALLYQAQAAGRGRAAP